MVISQSTQKNVQIMKEKSFDLEKQTNRIHYCEHKSYKMWCNIVSFFKKIKQTFATMSGLMCK